MGIDIYAHEIYDKNLNKYQGQFDRAVALRNAFERGSAGEETAQTEVSRLYNLMNSVGYLRESYHGGPYVTKYLVAEAFACDVRIEAKTLRKRLPIAVMLAIYRNHMVYEQGDAVGVINDDDTKNVKEALATLAIAMTKSRVKDDAAIIARITPTQVEHARQLIASEKLPYCAKQFVAFVEQCEAQEAKTGKPLLISASW